MRQESALCLRIAFYLLKGNYRINSPGHRILPFSTAKSGALHYTNNVSHYINRYNLKVKANRFPPACFFSTMGSFIKVVSAVQFSGVQLFKNL